MELFDPESSPGGCSHWDRPHGRADLHDGEVPAAESRPVRETLAVRAAGFCEVSPVRRHNAGHLPIHGLPRAAEEFEVIENVRQLGRMEHAIFGVLRPGKLAIEII